MPKYKIACFLLAAVLAAVGTVLVIRNLSSTDIPNFEKPIEDLNTYIDRTDDIDIDDTNADVRQFLFVAHKVLLSSKGFYGEANGTSIAVGVKQNVRNTRYVVGEFGHKNTFKEMVTKGVVSKAYQLFMYENNFVYRQGGKINSIDNVQWANTATALNEETFYSNFGHRNDKLTGYILNWDTVTSGELVDKTDGVYTFRYVLNEDTAPAYLKREMIFNGGLNSEPSFTRCVIYVAMDADFNVKTLRTDCEYKAQTMGINATCTEDITEVFTPYDGELPEKSFFEQYFTENPDDGIVTDQTALDVLLEMFSPYLNGEALQVAIEANSNGESVVSALVSIEGLDISDLSKLTVNAKLGNINLAYVHGDGAIYLKYKDFKGSTTVNGIMELVSTLLPLFGGDDGISLEGFDVEGLLDNLTFAVNGDKVVVSLPVRFGELTIDAKLYGEIDGEEYKFTNANIAIGDLVINITPSAWTVEELTGEYPEILGLADLLQNGKIGLTAKLTVGKYQVSADVLVELATGNLQLSAELGNNGTVDVSYVDGVAYITIGEVKLKLDTDNIGDLLEVIYKYTGIKFATVTPSVKVSAEAILQLLGSIATVKVEDGVDFKLSVLGIDATLRLVNDGGRWQIHSVTANAEGINAVILPADALGDVQAPASEGYADVTELAKTFIGPVLDIIRGKVYGANFNAALTIGGKQYDVEGSVFVDLNKTLKLTATVSDGTLGVIDAEVIYANNTVFLTLNGVKLAFAVGGSDVDVIAQLSELINNPQVKDILNSRRELTEIVEQATALIGVATNFTAADLLDVDFTAIVTAFSFENGKLLLSVNGSALGLDALALDISLSNANGCLCVGVGGLGVGNVTMSASATLRNNVETVVIPDTNDYMLNLAAELMGAEVQLTADLIHMDIWASVKYGNELMLVRYRDGKVYLEYGGAKVVLNTSELDAIVNKIGEAVGGLPQTGSLDVMKVLQVLSLVKADLTGETPNVSLDTSGVKASVNFTVKDSKLVFDSIAVRFTLDGKDYVATLSQQTKRADKLDITGEFVDGNALIDSIIDTVIAFRNINGISAELSLKLTVNGVTYDAFVTLNVNGGLYLNVIFKEGGKVAVSAEIYLVNGTLYFDVNGIRQAVELPDVSGELDIATVLGAIAQIEGVNDKIDALIEYAKRLPERLDGIVFSDIIGELTFTNGELALNLDLAQLDMGEVTLKLGLGNTLTVNAIGRVANVNYNTSVTLSNSSERVVAPELDSYVTVLNISMGSDINAIVKLDLYHNTVAGTALIYGQTVNFKYADGVIYATYGVKHNLRFKLALDDIEVLLGAISRFVQLPQVSLGGNGNIAETVMGIVENISFAKRDTDDGYTLEIDYAGVAVTVKFTSSANKVQLAKIEVSAGELTVTATPSNEYCPDLSTDGYYLDIAKIATFADNAYALMDACGYDIHVDGNVDFDGRYYAFDARVQLYNSELHVQFTTLSYQNNNQATKLVKLVENGQLWILNSIVDDKPARVLYLQVGDIKFAMKLDENTKDSNASLNDIDKTLEKALGYNGYVDEIIQLVRSILKTSLNDVAFDKLLTSAVYDDIEDKLTLGVDASQFGTFDGDKWYGLSRFVLSLGKLDNGLSLSLDNLKYKGITLNVNSADVVAYNTDVPKPEDYDFATYVVVDIKAQKPTPGGEENKIYAKIDLLKGVVQVRIESTLNDGTPTHLDVLYLINENVLKLTNGATLKVSVDIGSIKNIVNVINDIVNLNAGGVQEDLPDLFGSLGGTVEWEQILKTLLLNHSGNDVLLTAQAFGFDITASFNGGLNSVTVPVDILQSDLVVTFGKEPAVWYDFSTDKGEYVRIDQVFDDYYYGSEENKLNDTPTGAMYNLINTNCWKFVFNSDSEIDIKNDDNSTTTYQIITGSSVAFYYNKGNEQEPFKIRANITVQKDRGEFLYLDVAYINHRIYVTYDSRKYDTDSKGNVTKNNNELKVSVSLDSIKKTLGLKNALIEVVPQIGDLLKNMKEAMSSVESKLTLGNLSQILDSVTYTVGDSNVFGLQINGNALDSKFGAISLTVSNDGNRGLKLDQLKLRYDTVSVNIVDLVVTASETDEQGNFTYVKEDIESYFTEHGNIDSHINFDSIYELLSSFIITANDHDEQGNRHFSLQGDVTATLLGITVKIDIVLDVDIDKFNNVWLALRIVRGDEGTTAAYADKGGNSYLLLNSKDNTVQVVRDSVNEFDWCSDKDIPAEMCNGNTLHKLRYHTVFSKKTMLESAYNKLVKGESTPGYNETVTMQKFSENIMDYILKMVNFSSYIESKIREAGNGEKSVYGVEDILKDYKYVPGDKPSYYVEADLSAIDTMLGPLTVNIYHNDKYELTSLTGNIKLVKLLSKYIIDANLTLNLVEPSTDFDSENYIGIAQQRVKEGNYLW